MTIKRSTLLAGLAICANMALAPTGHADGLVEAGQLLVGSDLTYPPYDYLDDANQPAGFDAELATALAKAANLQVKFVDTRFENLIIGVSSDQFDVIASTLYVKPERAKRVDFLPYMKSGISIAVLQGSEFAFRTLEELCGHSFASVKGSAWLQRVEELNQTTCAGDEIDAREFPTAPEATQALLSGGVDAQVEDSAVLGEAARKLNGRIVMTNEDQLYPVIVALGLKKGNTELAEILENAMSVIKANGEYRALLTKYNVAAPTDGEFRAAVGQ